MKPNKRTKQIIVIISMVLIIATTACSSSSRNQVATEMPQPTSTRTRLPSSTPEPTVTPTLTITPTRTITPLPTARDDFSNTRVISHGPLPYWNYLITIELSQPVVGEYRMIIDTNNEYTCEIQPGHPNRLYCHGRQLRYNDEVEFYLIDADTEVKVFEDKIFVWYTIP